MSFSKQNAQENVCRSGRAAPGSAADLTVLLEPLAGFEEAPRRVVGRKCE